MKIIKKYVSSNWLWIVTGLILTEVAVRSAYSIRGYWAYGGEWMVLPLTLMIAEEIRIIGKIISFLLRREKEYDPDRD